MNPEVSIVMITYGHEKFIAQAIDSVFSQKTNFSMELILANDCSPDKSDEIIKHTIADSPNNIHVNYTFHSINKGMRENFLWALQQAKGKYIAILEGDDYWVDPLKLQKQYDFLEKNKNIAATGGLAKVVDEDNLNYSDIYGAPGKILKIKDFILLNNLVTCTVFFRNIKIFTIPKNLFFCDWTIYQQLLKTGDAFVFNEIFAVYRRHDSSAMKSLNEYKKNYQYSNQYFYNISKSKYGIRNFSPKDLDMINIAFFKRFKDEYSQRKYIKALVTIWRHFRLMKSKLGYFRYLNLNKY